MILIAIRPYTQQGHYEMSAAAMSVLRYSISTRAHVILYVWYSYLQFIFLYDHGIILH